MAPKKCVYCNKNITQKLLGLECSRCNKSVHASTTCAKLTNKQLAALRNSEGLEWSCEECLNHVSRRSSFFVPQDDSTDDKDRPISCDQKKMVNKYKRKTEQGLWNESTMKKAMQEVTEKKQAIKTTKYDIPRATLQRHLKSGSCKKMLGRFTAVFSEQQDKELLDYVFEMDRVLYGLSIEELA